MPNNKMDQTHKNLKGESLPFSALQKYFLNIPGWIEFDVVYLGDQRLESMFLVNHLKNSVSENNRKTEIGVTEIHLVYKEIVI